MVRFQTWITNLFLILREHNIHHQRRQLSKFLMRYQQFASHAYCMAARPVSKMALQQEKAFCVLCFEVSRSVITVQREFRAWFKKDAPHKNNISRWYRQFVESGCIAGHYSGHATPGLGRVRLPCGCVSCDPGCTYWRFIIKVWETWTVATADGVCCAGVSWEINFLLTFETTPFICVHSVYIHTHTHTHKMTCYCRLQSTLEIIRNIKINVNKHSCL
jgi:hypothetical protein